MLRKRRPENKEDNMGDKKAKFIPSTLIHDKLKYYEDIL